MVLVHLRGEGGGKHITFSIFELAIPRAQWFSVSCWFRFQNKNLPSLSFRRRGAITGLLLARATG